MTDDPELSRQIVRILAACETGEAYNHPTVRGDGGRSPGKPEGKSPGMQQCPALIRKLRRVLESAARDCERAVIESQPREVRATRVVSVGGVAMETVAGRGSITRQRIHTLTHEVRIARAVRRNPHPPVDGT